MKSYSQFKLKNKQGKSYPLSNDVFKFLSALLLEIKDLNEKNKK